MVAQRLPDLVKEMANLSLKMRKQREDVVVDNEKHI
jgi:hypothetical protein